MARGPWAAMNMGGVSAPPWRIRLLAPLKETSSPRNSSFMVRTARRIRRTDAGRTPTVCTELNPRPIQNSTRPGASSATVFMAEASTETWRVTGLMTAEEIRIRSVA